MAAAGSSSSTGLEAGNGGYSSGQPSLGRDGQAIAYKICMEPGCRRQFVKSRHRHCCSLCTSGAHTSKCDKLQKALLRGKVSTCATHGCWRWASHGHLYCCSDCKHGYGRFHSHACFDRQEWAVAVLATSAATTTATAASSSDPAPSDTILREPAPTEQPTSQDDRKLLSSKDVEVIDLEAMD